MMMMEMVWERAGKGVVLLLLARRAALAQMQVMQLQLEPKGS
jgi:hypothetical protein